MFDCVLENNSRFTSQRVRWLHNDVKLHCFGKIKGRLRYARPGNDGSGRRDKSGLINNLFHQPVCGAVIRSKIPVLWQRLIKASRFTEDISSTQCTPNKLPVPQKNGGLRMEHPQRALFSSLACEKGERRSGNSARLSQITFSCRRMDW